MADKLYVGRIINHIVNCIYNPLYYVGLRIIIINIYFFAKIFFCVQLDCRNSLLKLILTKLSQHELIQAAR